MLVRLVVCVLTILFISTTPIHVTSLYLHPRSSHLNLPSPSVPLSSSRSFLPNPPHSQSSPSFSSSSSSSFSLGNLRSVIDDGTASGTSSDGIDFSLLQKLERSTRYTSAPTLHELWQRSKKQQQEERKELERVLLEHSAKYSKRSSHQHQHDHHPSTSSSSSSALQPTPTPSPSPSHTSQENNPIPHPTSSLYDDSEEQLIGLDAEDLSLLRLLDSTSADARTVLEELQSDTSLNIPALLPRLTAAQHKRERLKRQRNSPFPSSIHSPPSPSLYRRNISLIPSVLDDSSILRSPSDSRSYRILTLSNGLSVLLVSDSNTSICSASMNVGSGHYSDPSSLPGLAHFLEHMLFLGTKKYPAESGFSDFIEAHGGDTNAYTAAENTNFYFDITPSFFPSALDQFSQFFLSPLLSTSATQRELNAVHSEHSKNLQSDDWRSSRLLQHLSNVSHPFHKFGTGCKGSLGKVEGEKLLKELRRFWEKHYRAKNMKLAVLCDGELDGMEEMVSKMFEGIEEGDRDHILKGLNERDVFEKKLFMSEITMQSITDSTSLNLLFPIPSQQPYYTRQSIAFLSHLLSSFHFHSLTHSLKSLHYIHSASAGLDVSTSSFALFLYSVELTKEGYENRYKIIEAFYEYVKEVKEKGIERWRYEELKRISELQWEMKAKEKAADYTSYLSKKLHLYEEKEWKNVLQANELFEEFDEKHIENLLDEMREENMIVFCSGAKLLEEEGMEEEEVKEEPWYGIKYVVKEIDGEWRKRWKRAREKSTDALWRSGSGFTLPDPNTFIPTDLSLSELVVPPLVTPLILYDQHSVRLWYSQDNEFFKPSGLLLLRLYSPSLSTSPRSILLTTLYLSLIEELLQPHLYLPSLAGFSYHLHLGLGFIDVSTTGYTEGLIKYAEAVIGALVRETKGKKEKEEKAKEGEMNEKLFKTIQKRILTDYANRAYYIPHKQSSSLASYVLSPHLYSDLEEIAILKTLTYQDLLFFLQNEMLKEVEIEMYYHGNALPTIVMKESLELVDSLQLNYMNYTTEQREALHLHSRLPMLTDHYILVTNASNAADVNSAVLNYYQFSASNKIEGLYTQLLANIIQKPCFYQLRTVEQLGYIVWSMDDIRLHVNGLRIQVQSSLYSSVYLSSRISAFIDSFRSLISSLDPSSFYMYVDSLAASKLQRPIDADVQANWNWNEITSRRYVFNRRELESIWLSDRKRVNLKGFKEFFERYFGLQKDEGKMIQAGVLSVRIESQVKRKMSDEETAATIGMGKETNKGKKDQERQMRGENNSETGVAGKSNLTSSLSSVMSSVPSELTDATILPQNTTVAAYGNATMSNKRTSEFAKLIDEEKIMGNDKRKKEKKNNKEKTKRKSDDESKSYQELDPLIGLLIATPDHMIEDVLSESRVHELTNRLYLYPTEERRDVPDVIPNQLWADFSLRKAEGEQVYALMETKQQH